MGCLGIRLGSVEGKGSEVLFKGFKSNGDLHAVGSPRSARLREEQTNPPQDANLSLISIL